MNLLKYILPFLFLFPATFPAQDSADGSHILQVQLLKMEQERIYDSLKKIELLTELEKLKSEEKAKRSELELRLNSLSKADSARKAQKLEHISHLRKTTKGFPVAPFKDTLFFIYARSGSFQPAERANAITQRIKKLYELENFSKDSLVITRSENSIEIAYRDKIILSLTETDGFWADETIEALAKNYRNLIADAVTNEIKEHTLLSILLRIGLVLLILAGAILIIYGVNSLFKRSATWLSGKKDNWFKGLKIKTYQLLDSDRQLGFFLFLNKVLRIIIIITVLYLVLPFLFSVFPWTQGWAEILFGWILTPLKKIGSGLIGYLPNLITIVIIYMVTRYAIKFFRFLALEIQNGALVLSGFHKEWAIPTFNILKFLLYAFMFIMIFPYLPGSDSPIFQGVSVFLGVLISFGSSSAISNIVAGMVITYMRPFKIGDRVKIGEVTGDVIEKNLLVTRIRTIKNEDITVPNSSVLSGHSVNYSSSSQNLGLILHTTVTIGYDVPWKKVHELLISAAKASKEISNKKEPFVLQTSLDDFYVAYQINAYTENPNLMAETYSSLHQNIQDKFNEAGVEILSPHYRGLRDGNATTIPADYLPPDYIPPSLNIKKNDK
jgi:small-conductance mechanosensitive channel